MAANNNPLAVEDCPQIACGEERSEGYVSPLTRDLRVEYAYRAPDGELFLTNAPTVDVARARRDAWMKSRRDGGQ